MPELIAKYSLLLAIAEAKEDKRFRFGVYHKDKKTSHVQLTLCLGKSVGYSSQYIFSDAVVVHRIWHIELR